jgi:hypothetical protein
MHKTSVRPLSPWREQRVIFSGKPSQKAPERIVCRGEDSGDVLPNDDGGLLSSEGANMVNCIGDLAEGQGQVAARIVERSAQASDGERLAGRAPSEHVGRFDLARQDAPGDRGHVAEVRDGRIVVSEDSAGERLNLGKPCGLPPQRMPRDGCGLNAATNRSKLHALTS